MAPQNVASIAERIRATAAPAEPGRPPVTGGVLPDPRVQPTISIPEAGRLLGLGRAASYAAADRGEIPFIQVGRKKRVPTAKLLALLGL